MSAGDRRMAQKPCNECGAQVAQYHALDCSDAFAPSRQSLERIADALERLVTLVGQHAAGVPALECRCPDKQHLDLSLCPTAKQGGRFA